MRRQFHTWLAIPTIAAVYFCAGKLGLSLAFVNASTSAVWPPTGIALAALLLWGYRLWPGIFIGAFLVNITTQGSLATTLGIALGNTLEAVLGAWAVGRYANGLKAFERPENIFRFVLVAAILSTMVSATLGVTSLCLGGFAGWEQYWSVWLTWWLGDLVSDVIVAPVLVIWLAKPLPRMKPRLFLEGLGLLLLIVLAGQLVFGAGNYPLGYLALLPLLLAALRFGERATVLGAFITSCIALGGTLRGHGPFATGHPNESLLFVQAFIGTITLTALMLASVISERKRAEQRLYLRDVVNRVLAESATLMEAVPRVIQALCETAGWEVGAIWTVNRTANELSCAGFWHVPAVSVPEFEFGTRQRTFAPGIGLPGRVWSSGRPAWIPDVTKDGNFPRASAALKEGLHSAYCFPMKLGHDIVGVTECFSREVREPEDNFLRMLAALGNQLGQFIERKRAEEALRESEARLANANEELEKKVRERTAKLNVTIAELEAFSYSLSHDMRAPLRSIQSFSRIVLADYGEKIDSAGTEYLQKVIRSSERLDRLIQDVLALGCVSRQEIKVERVDVDKLVRHIIHERPELQPPKAEIDIRGPLPAVCAHEASLTQCITNLLDNAVKFVERGKRPHVIVRSEAVSDQVRIWFEDNGIGMAPSARERVFGIFQRFHNDHAYPGNGIGLAIVHRAVGRMSGTVGVESEPAKGSRFWLQLPRGG